jgi:hypothetical protein
MQQQDQELEQMEKTVISTKVSSCNMSRNRILQASSSDAAALHVGSQPAVLESFPAVLDSSSSSSSVSS